MRISQVLLVALRSVRANLLRSGLTMLGIVIGIASVMSVLAIGSGAQSDIASQIRSVGSDVLMISPGTTQHAGARQKAGSLATLTEGDVTALADQIPQISAAAGSLSGSAQIIREDRNWNTTINGTDARHFSVRDWPLAAGRYFSSEEEKSAGKVVILGSVVAHELFQDLDALHAPVRIESVPFEVVGVLEPKGQDQDDVAFVPLSTAKLRFLGSASVVHRDAVAYVIAKAVSDDAVPEATRQIKALLRQRHHINKNEEDDFRVTDPAEVMNAQHATTRTIALLLVAVACVSLLVGGISIMNMMIVSITERTREIGIRRAVGARSRDIMLQFIAETLVLCLVGGVVGVTLGVVASLTFASMSGWPVTIDPQAVVLSVTFAALTGLFFGYYPARRAARLNPIEALKSE